MLSFKNYVHLTPSTFQDGHYIVNVKQRCINTSGERQFEFRFSLQNKNSVDNKRERKPKKQS